MASTAIAAKRHHLGNDRICITGRSVHGVGTERSVDSGRTHSAVRWNRSDHHRAAGRRPLRLLRPRNSAGTRTFRTRRPAAIPAGASTVRRYPRRHTRTLRLAPRPHHRTRKTTLAPRHHPLRRTGLKKPSVETGGLFLAEVIPLSEGSLATDQSDCPSSCSSGSDEIPVRGPVIDLIAR